MYPRNKTNNLIFNGEETTPTNSLCFHISKLYNFTEFFLVKFALYLQLTDYLANEHPRKKYKFFSNFTSNFTQKLQIPQNYFLCTSLSLFIV